MSCGVRPPSSIAHQSNEGQDVGDGHDRLSSTVFACLPLCCLRCQVPVGLTTSICVCMCRMCVCACDVCVCVVCVCMRVWTRFECMCKCVLPLAWTCAYPDKHAHAQKCSCPLLDTQACVHARTHTCTHAHKHTHTNTHTFAL